MRALVTDGAGQRTLHADELGREPGEPSDQQPHRSDPHAGLQGNIGSDVVVLPEAGESPLPAPIPLRPSDAAAGVEVERKWKRPDYTEPGSQKFIQDQDEGNQISLNLVKRDQSLLKGSAPWRVPYPRTT